MVLFIIITIIVALHLIGKLVAIIIHKDCKSKVCLVGKTALVTGGNSGTTKFLTPSMKVKILLCWFFEESPKTGVCSPVVKCIFLYSPGIGYQIVLALAQRGCRVIIVDKEQDTHLLENIYNETKSKNVLFKYVDLSSFNSVRALAKDLTNDEDKLDILVNNAGIGSTVTVATEDGLDITMQVNYFSAFLLTHLLVDLVKKAEGRIIFTSSLMSFIHNFTLEKIKSVGIKYSFYAYQNSKVCTIIAADIFAEKLKKYNVTCNTCHPGLVGTSIYKKSRFDCTNSFYWIFSHILEYIALVFGKTAEEGAQTAIHLACANEVKGITKEFFIETKPCSKPKLCYDKKQCELIWDATEDIVKLASNEKL